MTMVRLTITDQRTGVTGVGHGGVGHRDAAVVDDAAASILMSVYGPRAAWLMGDIAALAHCTITDVRIDAATDTGTEGGIDEAHQDGAYGIHESIPRP